MVDNQLIYLPRPRHFDKYRGSLPLHAEKIIYRHCVEILGDDNLRVLNMFSGKAKFKNQITLDLSDECQADLKLDAHNFATGMRQKFDVVFADPPYSNRESAEIYSTGKLNYKWWSSEALKVLQPDGLFVVWHKRKMPNPMPGVFVAVKRLAVIIRINHDLRLCEFFRNRRYVK